MGAWGLLFLGVVSMVTVINGAVWQGYFCNTQVTYVTGCELVTL